MGLKGVVLNKSKISSYKDYATHSNIDRNFTILMGDYNAANSGCDYTIWKHNGYMFAYIQKSLDENSLYLIAPVEVETLYSTNSEETVEHRYGGEIKGIKIGSYVELRKTPENSYINTHYTGVDCIEFKAFEYRGYEYGFDKQLKNVKITINNHISGEVSKFTRMIKHIEATDYSNFNKINELIKEDLIKESFFKANKDLFTSKIFINITILVILIIFIAIATSID